MSTQNRYDENFKRTIVELYHNDKTQASLVKEYGIFQTALIKWFKMTNFIQSFSRKGFLYDNTCCESFFLHMKRECLGRENFRNQDELRLACIAYLQ